MLDSVSNEINNYKRFEECIVKYLKKPSRVIGNNDIITIDLSPQVANIWGDYARTIIVEK